MTGNFFRLLGLITLFSSLSFLAFPNTKPFQPSFSVSLLSDSSSVKEKIKTPIRISGARLNIGVAEPILSLISTDSISYEFGAEILLNNIFFISTEIGYKGFFRNGRDRDQSVFFFRSSGNYQRVGVDYNILHKKTLVDAYFIGLRYGWSKFDQSVFYGVEDLYWTLTEGNSLRIQRFNDTDLKAHWTEITTGFRVHIIKGLYVSSILRVKRLLNFDAPDNVSVAAIPGYGFLKGNSQFQINLQVSYKFDFSKKRFNKLIK